MTKRKKTILIASVILAAGAAIAVPVTVHYSGKPNFAKMNPRQIRQYFDSNAFRDANEDKRREIRGEMFEAMQARMEQQVNGYFALPEGDQRVAYLDNLIDEMQAQRAEFMAGRDPNRRFDPNRPFDPNRFADPNRPRRFGPPDANGQSRFAQRGANGQMQRPRINPERMRERSSRTSADTRVKTTQFRRDLMQRMQQRGIQGPMGRGGPGGFRGPGGVGFGGPGRGFGPP
jgi:hypothetical protein